MEIVKHELENEERKDETIQGNGTYYVDAQGQYYYHELPDLEPMQCISGGEKQKKTENTDEFVFICNDGKDVPEFEENQTWQFLPCGDNDEISYFVIVEQSDEIKKEQEIVKEQFQKQNYNSIINSNSGQEIENNNISKDTKSESINSESISKNKWVCSYCKYESTQKYLMNRHMKSHYDVRPYICHICDRGFKSKPCLINHVNTHTGLKPYICKHCQRTFTTSGELVRHIRYRHTQEKPHKCSECDYAAVESSKLKRHMMCHTGERPYQCPHCTYASPDTFKLNRHLRVHTGEKPYTCKVCNSSFSQSNSLKSHAYAHNPTERPIFQCQLCPATCTRKNDLRIHIQKFHTSNKPIKCQHCDAFFVDKYTYKIHKKTHQGEKFFKCEFCSYSCVAARYLRTHVLRHTEEKPFECEHCDGKFRQKALLKRHQNLHHNLNYLPPSSHEKKFECFYCKKLYAYKGNLIRHINSYCGPEKLDRKSGHIKKVRNSTLKVNEQDAECKDITVEIMKPDDEIINDPKETAFFVVNIVEAGEEYEENEILLQIAE